MVNDPSSFRSHPSKTGCTFWPRFQRSWAAAGDAIDTAASKAAAATARTMRI